MKAVTVQTGSVDTAENCDCMFMQSSSYAVGKSYLVQGTITALSDSFVSVKVDKNIRSANSAIDNPDFPIKVGSEVKVQLKSPLGSSPSIQAGATVVLNIAQCVTDSNQSLFWGLMDNGFYFEQNGSFYDLKGNKLSLSTGTEK